MIKVTETLFIPREQPVITTKELPYSKKELLQILGDRYGMHNHAIYELRKTNECYFSIAGVKRKLEIKEESVEMANGGEESV